MQIAWSTVRELVLPSTHLMFVCGRDCAVFQEFCFLTCFMSISNVSKLSGTNQILKCSSFLCQQVTDFIYCICVEAHCKAIIPSCLLRTFIVSYLVWLVVCWWICWVHKWSSLSQWSDDAVGVPLLQLKLFYLIWLRCSMLKYNRNTCYLLLFSTPMFCVSVNRQVYICW